MPIWSTIPLISGITLKGWLQCEVGPATVGRIRRFNRFQFSILSPLPLHSFFAQALQLPRLIFFSAVTRAFQLMRSSKIGDWVGPLKSRNADQPSRVIRFPFVI
jgi:hypothetical protein